MVGDVFFESLLKKLKEASKSDYQSICDSFLDSQVDSVMQTRISCIDTVEKNFRDGLQKFLAHHFRKVCIRLPLIHPKRFPTIIVPL